VSFNLPEKPTVDHTASTLEDGNLLRRRLLGAAVLIALAVIILPLLLDGSGTESRFRRVERLREEPPRIVNETGRVEVPADPVVNKPVPETTPQKNIEPVADDQVEPEPEPTPEPTPEPEPEPAPEPAPEPVTIALPTEAVEKSPSATAWVVQAGSFSDQVNALKMRDQLRSAGLPSFVSSVSSGAEGAELYRVKVGPISDRNSAVEVQQRVQSLVGRETLLREYR